MPLIAEHLEQPGRLLMPGEDGVRRAKCPDLVCQRAMTYISPLVDNGEVLRVDHWRHQASPDGTTCPRASGDAEKMTPWHRSWQETCTDLGRLEVIVEHGTEQVRADIITPYTWAVEVQHSSISNKNVAKRERVNQGRVVWLLDAGSEKRDGETRFYRGKFEWTASMGLDRIPAKTITVVDRGPQGLALLPPDWAQYRFPVQVAIPQALVRQIGRDEFIRDWVNGPELPVNSTITLYAKKLEEERIAASENRAQREAKQRQEREEAERRRRAHEIACQYDGDRSRLVPVDDTPPQGPPVETSPDSTLGPDLFARRPEPSVIEASIGPGQVEPSDAELAPRNDGPRKVPAVEPAPRTHPCIDCGQISQLRAGTRCPTCWQELGVVNPFTVAQRREMAKHPIPSNPRTAVFAGGRPPVSKEENQTEGSP